ncbi:MAG TPA: DUF4440 domain-containing protein [Candidatus Sulfotelmatobacter sp.]|nr:DUF4440 domain-containing protein [Candidatus Sulfotelmatobacter sp.]
MKKTAIAVAVLLLAFAGAATAQEKQAMKPKAGGPPLEAQVRKIWEGFKNKDKAAVSALVDDHFRLFEEGMSAFGDKKAEVNSVDEYQLASYTLSDFTVKPLGPNAALVTYMAQYEGKSGGEAVKAKSAFGEVWIRAGQEWKSLYVQETYVK